MKQYIIPPKLLIIQDMVTVGRSSMSVAIPVVSACKVQACPITNAVFSSHMGFESFYKKDLSDSLENILQELGNLPIEFSGVYIGYLGSVSQLTWIKGYIERFKYETPNKPFILDPVFGDHGLCYKSITQEYYESLKNIIQYADVITPNITEACNLAGYPYHEGFYSSEEIFNISKRLFELGAKNIIITGIRKKDYFYNYVVIPNEPPFVIKNKSAGIPRPGTGDIFCSILSALYVRNFPLIECVKHACHFIECCAKFGKELEIPREEGAPLELYLHYLTSL